MHRAAVVVILSVFALMISGCSPSITPEEAKVLVVLEEIRRGVESNIEYDQFEQLLKKARAELDILKHHSKKNPCFVNAVSKCYASYEIAGKAWQKKLETTDEKRKEDMDMTLSFSLSFSALNIQKATNCYK